MSISSPGESGEYRKVRNELLGREIELRRAMLAVYFYNHEDDIQRLTKALAEL